MRLFEKAKNFFSPKTPLLNDPQPYYGTCGELGKTEIYQGSSQSSVSAASEAIFHTAAAQVSNATTTADESAAERTSLVRR